MNYPEATITAVDTPSKYWYQGITAYGDTCRGVRLYGTGAKFSTGQKVTAFQCGSEYGFSEKGLGYKSQLTIPDAQKASVANEAPASVALAYIAHLANNDKVYYVPGTVLEIIDTFKMVVSSTLSASPLTLTCVIKTTGFYKGARVLIQSHPYNARVIGWWNCLPDEAEDDKPEWWTDEHEEEWQESWWNSPEYGFSLSRKDQVAVVIGRIPWTADVDIAIVTYRNGTFNRVKFNRFNHRDPASNFAWITTYPTTEADEYFYSKVMMGVLYGGVLERYWLKWHKKTLAVTEIPESQYPPHPGVLWSLVKDVGWGWTDAGYSEHWCYITTPPGYLGPRINTIYTGPTNDEWLPLLNYKYVRNDYK